MFFLDELQQLRGFGLLDEFERVAVLERGEQPARHVVGLAGAERPFEDLLGVLDAAFVDVLERDRALVGFLDDRVALLDRNRRDLGDLENDAFDFVLAQELEDRRREVQAPSVIIRIAAFSGPAISVCRIRNRPMIGGRVAAIALPEPPIGPSLIIDIVGYSASQSLTSLAMLSGFSWRRS